MPHPCLLGLSSSSNEVFTKSSSVMLILLIPPSIRRVLLQRWQSEHFVAFTKAVYYFFSLGYALLVVPFPLSVADRAPNTLCVKFAAAFDAAAEAGPLQTVHTRSWLLV